MKNILVISAATAVFLGGGCIRPAASPAQPANPAAVINILQPEKPNLKQPGWEYFISQKDNGLYAQRRKEPSILLTKIDVVKMAPARQDLESCDVANEVKWTADHLLIQCVLPLLAGEGPSAVIAYFLNKEDFSFVRPETLPEDVVTASTENTEFSPDGDYQARFGFDNQIKEYVAIFDLVSLKDTVTYPVPDGFTFLKNPESWATLTADQPSVWEDNNNFNLRLFKSPPIAGNRKPARTEKLSVTEKLTDGGVELPGVWTNPVFGFSFTMSLGVVAKIDKSGGAIFIDPATKTEYATMIIQPGIPQVSLPANKIENIKLDGVAAKIFHDTDSKTGTVKIDKLWVQMPNSENVILVQLPVAQQENFDFTAMIKTWKWNLKK